jgi:X-X-X-Leu-X-X-Gly heptad repeat protein
VIRRSKDLVPALLYLAVREVLGRRDEPDAGEAGELADRAGTFADGAGELTDGTGELELIPAAGTPAT